VTDATERGTLNGWMQAGMLAGRAAMGGGALVLSSLIGDAAVVLVLVSITTLSGGLLLGSVLPSHLAPSGHDGENPETIIHRLKSVLSNMRAAMRGSRLWIGLVFALTGPAAFKAFEVVIGPFLIDRGLTQQEVGKFTAVVMIGAMVFGSLVGGRLADRFSRKGFVAVSLMFIVASLTTLAIADIVTEQSGGRFLLVLIAVTAFGIGLFTVATYAMFMDLTEPRIAATQFSAFMGATNGCESWSTLAIGQMIAGYGYAFGILSLCAVSAASLLLLPFLQRSDTPRSYIAQK
jgi:predicted MFS family arabinose efflux permease